MRSLRPVIAAAGIAASLALTACSGDDRDTAATLDRAFSQPVQTADVTLDLRARVRGSRELEDPMRLRARGPFVSGGSSEIPSVDWDVTLDGRGTGFSARAVSNGDNAWVEVLGTAYEVGEDAVARVNRRLERQEHDRRGLEELGLNPRRWLVDPREDGDEEVAGVDTTHFSARLDVARFLDDVEAAAVRAGRPEKAGKLTPEERRQIVDAVDDAGFDVWVGKDDDVIRRLTAELEFDVPEKARGRHHGVESGEMSFLLELADVGGDQEQRIRVPRGARPIEELLEALGSGGRSLGVAVPRSRAGGA